MLMRDDYDAAGIIGPPFGRDESQDLAVIIEDVRRNYPQDR